MRTIYIILTILSATIYTTYSQEFYKTEVKDGLIKTLQVKVADEPLSNPVIELNGEEQIEISFDALHSGYNRYAYSIIHCDADWQQSSLIPVEYMNGFFGLPIEDFSTSMATTTQYTNYKLYLPNDEITLKVSGNYAIKVYDEYNPDKVALYACFSVTEQAVGIGAQITSNTNIDTNRSHQQLNFFVNHQNINIPYPQSDIKIHVYQNNRRDNMVKELTPIGIGNNQLEYSNIRELIFEAGNEYRRMEFLTHRFNGMNVDNISFHAPYYNVTLMPDIPRANRNYQYDQDQNGRIYINCSGCNNPDTEADYFIVHFTVPTQPLAGGGLYLLSDIYNNVLDERSKMGYNRETGQYEKSIQLKQGLYNYQYIFVPDGQTKGTTAPIEGNYFQTENEYSIYVYYRPMSERYDRLLGVTTVQNTMTVF